MVDRTCAPAGAPDVVGVGVLGVEPRGAAAVVQQNRAVEQRTHVAHALGRPRRHLRMRAVALELVKRAASSSCKPSAGKGYMQNNGHQGGGKWWAVCSHARECNSTGERTTSDGCSTMTRVRMRCRPEVASVAGETVRVSAHLHVGGVVAGSTEACATVPPAHRVGRGEEAGCAHDKASAAHAAGQCQAGRSPQVQRSTHPSAGPPPHPTPRSATRCGRRPPAAPCRPG